MENLPSYISLGAFVLLWFFFREWMKGQKDSFEKLNNKMDIVQATQNTQTTNITHLANGVSEVKGKMDSMLETKARVGLLERDVESALRGSQQISIIKEEMTIIKRDQQTQWQRIDEVKQLVHRPA